MCWAGSVRPTRASASSTNPKRIQPKSTYVSVVFSRAQSGHVVSQIVESMHCRMCNDQQAFDAVSASSIMERPYPTQYSTARYTWSSSRITSAPPITPKTSHRRSISFVAAIESANRCCSPTRTACTHSIGKRRWPATTGQRASSMTQALASSKRRKLFALRALPDRRCPRRPTEHSVHSFTGTTCGC